MTDFGNWLTKAFLETFPDGIQTKCYYHIKQNIKKSYPNISSIWNYILMLYPLVFIIIIVRISLQLGSPSICIYCIHDSTIHVNTIQRLLLVKIKLEFLKSYKIITVSACLVCRHLLACQFKIFQVFINNRLNSFPYFFPFFRHALLSG